MPVSKKRVRKRPQRKRRQKGQEIRARETQAAQAKAASVKKVTPAAYRARRIFGWSLVVLAVVVFATHLLEHVGTISFASQGVEDVVAGFPMAAVLGMVGVIVLST